MVLVLPLLCTVANCIPKILTIYK
uniref:Nudix hydrolase 23ic-like n=1 Tax=Rhizophora mucronata TaxID=61149 RepID=A0A2P2KBX3_RHIMU